MAIPALDFESYFFGRKKRVFLEDIAKLHIFAAEEENLSTKTRNIMKKIAFILMAFVMTMCLPVQADNDRVITYDQLPAQAQTLLKDHFANKVPLIITMDFDDYKVMYQSGEKVEFDKKGNWKDIECKASAVPTAIIPEQIKANVKKTFPAATIIKIDRDRRGYDVKLNNGMEIEFDKKFNVVDIDD